MRDISTKLNNFIVSHKELFQQNALQEIYDRVPVMITAELTDMFHEINVEPLNVLTDVPAGYAVADTYYEDLIFPKQVDKLEEEGFFGAQHLKEVSFDSTHVSYLGPNLFSNSSLVKIVFPDTVDRLGDFICDQCIHLEHVQLPRYVNFHIGDKLFARCPKLQSVHYPGTKEEFIDVYHEEINLLLGADISVVCKDGILK